MSNFREKTRGKWIGILQHFGVDLKLLNGKHQGCPFCGGKDRWRFDNKEGTGSWFCTNCGSGSGTDLIMKQKGWDFKRAADEIDEMVGTVKPMKLKAERSPAAKRSSLQALWKQSNPISRGDPVAKWLNSRVGNIIFPSCLRYVQDIVYAGDPPTRHPAMLARVDGLDGSPQTIHRTYITMEGKKAEVEDNRRLMPGSFEAGSAVRLFPPSGGRLAIAEGIETSLAVLKLTAIPCWALLNTANMGSFEPPEGVKELFIFGDHDRNYAGQAAAYGLAKKLHPHLKVHVMLPEDVGDDWNDVLQKYHMKDR